jgi:hypothetical protein
MRTLGRWQADLKNIFNILPQPESPWQRINPEKGEEKRRKSMKKNSGFLPRGNDENKSRSARISKKLHYILMRRIAPALPSYTDSNSKMRADFAKIACFPEG